MTLLPVIETVPLVTVAAVDPLAGVTTSIRKSPVIGVETRTPSELLPMIEIEPVSTIEPVNTPDPVTSRPMRLEPLAKGPLARPLLASVPAALLSVRLIEPVLVTVPVKPPRMSMPTTSLIPVAPI